MVSRIFITTCSLLLSYVIITAQNVTASYSNKSKSDSTITNTPSELGYKEVRGIGLGSLALKDEATSPLIYQGILISLFRTKVKRNEYQETALGFKPIFGATISSTNSEVDLSGVFGASIYYTYLRNVPTLSFSNVDVSIGGTLDLTTVSRANPSFQNNAIGFDVFPAVLGSIKLNKSFIGKSPWGDNFSLLEMFRFRKKKPMVHQELAFQLDVGIINTNYRNGYAYTIHAPFYNSRNILSDHQFHWFSGFRIRSNFSYIVFSSKTKNGIKLSYSWEGARTGRDPDRFAFATGMFQFSLIHRLY